MLFVYHFSSYWSFEILVHDIQELIQKFSNRFLIDVVQEAVNDVWARCEDVWYQLLLFSVDQEGD